MTQEVSPDDAARTAPPHGPGALRWLTCGAWVLALAAFAAAVGFGSFSARQEATAVTVVVDDRAETVSTMRSDVRGLLADLGLALRPEDRVVPSLDTRLQPGAVIAVQRARPCMIYADGETYLVHTHAATVGGVLAGADMRLTPGDEIWMDGSRVGPETLLPHPQHQALPVRFARPRAWTGQALAPVSLEIRRARQITVDDGSVPYTILTTAPTVGEALLREGLILYLGDVVRPALGHPVRSGMRVAIERSKPLSVTADGRTIRTRTRRETVGDALVDLGIVVSGADRTIPALADPILADMQIRVVRVLETVEVERQVIPYESVMMPDDQLEIDHQRLAQAGADGEYRKRFRVVKEDGVETARILLDEWLATPAVPRIVSYGRKIVSRTLETPDGTINYWRKITMYATAYSAATSGTPRSAPWYGRTRIGLQLTKGLVAVDPKVIPLGTKVYVPGYGVGLAADTGGGVRGRMIDLGYDDWNLQSWHWWVDVYVLDPPPAPAKVTWVLPKYPEGRFPMRRR